MFVFVDQICSCWCMSLLSFPCKFNCEDKFLAKIAEEVNKKGADFFLCFAMRRK